jgi:hypothetical protein
MVGINPNTVELRIQFKLLPLDGGGWERVKRQDPWKSNTYN